MIPKFERGILISVIFLVASLLITVFLSPTKKEVMAPREGLETFNVARAQHVIIKRQRKSEESLEAVHPTPVILGKARDSSIRVILAGKSLPLVSSSSRFNLLNSCGIPLLFTDWE